MSSRLFAGIGIAILCSFGVARADDDVKSLAAKIATLEARVKVLEDINAKYKEALEFLQLAWAQQKQQQAAQDESTASPDAIFAVEVANPIKHGQIEGAVDAAVTIVMAFDFADPYSFKSHAVLQGLLAEYKGKLRVVYKNMIVHPQTATTAHNAGCAAGNQRKFPEFMRTFWKDAYEPYTQTRDATKLDASAMLAIAKSLKFDVKRFETDMNSDACTKRVQADMTELSAFRVNATPTFYINGTIVDGAMPKETFKDHIDAKLKLVAASKVAAAVYYDREILAKGEKKFRSKKDAKH